MKQSSCDGKPLCGLAAKVPKVLRGSLTKSGSAVDKDKLNRECLVAIIDKLFKKQSYISDIHAILFSADYPMDTGVEELRAEWPLEGCRTIRPIPKGWMAAWLVQQWGSSGFNKEIVRALEDDDPTNISQIFVAALQLPLGSQLPAGVQMDEKLACELFIGQMAIVGDRITPLLKEGGINRAGIDCSKGGAYSLEWNPETSICTKIIHKATKCEVVPPPHAMITKDFCLIDNLMDLGSRVVLDPSDWPLHKFFPPDGYVAKGIVTDKMAKAHLAKLLIKIVTAKLAAVVLASASSGRDAHEALSEVSKAEASKRTQKAREVMAVRKLNRSAKMRVQLK
jgi:hypothetical protein